MIEIFDGNNVMLRALNDMVLPGQTRMTIRQRYMTALNAAPGTHIWVWDGYRHNDRRKEIYPRYKGNREPMAEDMFSQIQLFRELLCLSNAIQVEADGWEADDLVGALTHKFAARRVPVTINTNDLDYAQLSVLPNVTLNGVRRPDDLPPRWIALYKATVGDPSDNISGIPGFGPKTWEGLKDWWPQLERAIQQGNPGGFAGLPMPKRIATWLSSQDNIDLLQAMLLITHFHPVPDETLAKAIKPGRPDYRAADETMRRYFL